MRDHRSGNLFPAAWQRRGLFGWVGIPGASGFGRDPGKAHARRRVGDTDQVLAGRALDLATREWRLALQRLIAVETLEFEFVHAQGL